MDQTTAEEVFIRVWRSDFGRPGFCLVDFGVEMDSSTLRSSMIALKQRLDEASRRRGGPSLSYLSMGSVDQRLTTKFHLDGVPDEALLMLGYEPSAVRSRLYIADFTRCAFDLGIEPKQFLSDFNPMYRQGEELLAAYLTELPQPGEGRWRILLINNSSLPCSTDRANTLGVLHKAEILDRADRERRVVNSIMLTTGGNDQLSAAQQHEFVTTNTIGSPVYPE